MNKELIKNFVVYGVIASLGKFLNIFLLPIYTKIFSPDEYGVIDLIQSIIVILAIFGILQLDSSLQRYYFDNKDEKERNNTISTIFSSILFCSILLAVVTILFSEDLSLLFFDDIQYSEILILASLLVPLINISNILKTLLRFQKKPIVFGTISLLEVCVVASTSIWLVVFEKIGIIGVFYGQVVGFAFSSILQIYFVRDVIKLYWDFTQVKTMLKFSLPQFPARLVGVGNEYINRFFMISLLSTTEIGLYSIAVKLAAIFTLFRIAFNYAWYPFLYESLNQKGHKKLISEIFDYLVIVMMSMVVVISLFSKDLITIFAPESYYSASPLIGLVSLYITFLIIGNMVSLGPQVAKKTKYLTYTYVISFFVNVVLLYLLTSQYGVIGVPISTVIANFVLMCGNWYYTQKLYPINFSYKIIAIGSIIAVGSLVLSINVELSMLVKVFITSAFVMFFSIFLYKKLKKQQIIKF